MKKNSDNFVTLRHLSTGEIATIRQLKGDVVTKQRLMALGIIRGQKISLDIQAPLGDPRIYSIMGYRLSIRNEDADNILISQQ
ncbi:MAG: ferrous iron transport protein A [Magnetococcus sp. DMHC-6]